MGIRKLTELPRLKVCEEQYRVKITTSYWSHSSKLERMLLMFNLFIAHLDDRQQWIINKFANNAKLVEVIHRLMNQAAIEEDWQRLGKAQCTWVLGGTRKTKILGFIQSKVEKTRGKGILLLSTTAWWKGIVRGHRQAQQAQLTKKEVFVMHCDIQGLRSAEI